MNTIRSIVVVLALVLAAAVGFTEQKPREVRPPVRVSKLPGLLCP